MKVILSCKCGDTPKFAEDAYSLLFPGESTTPEQVVGEYKIGLVATRFSPSSEARQYISGLAQTKDRFAIYLSVDEAGNIIETYNLLTGNRIQ